MCEKKTKYTIAWEPSGLLVKFNGKLSVEDIHEAPNEVYGDARFDYLRYSIWDFTKADLSSIQKEDMMIFVGEGIGATYILKSHKLAIIVKEIHAQNVMTFYIEESIKNGSVWKFSTHENEISARNWINT